MRFKLLLLFTLIFSSFASQAQEYLRMIDAGTYKVQDIIDSAEAYFQAMGIEPLAEEGEEQEEAQEYFQFKRWEYNAIRMVKDNGYLPTTEERLNELQQWNAYLNNTAQNRIVLAGQLPDRPVPISRSKMDHERVSWLSSEKAALS